MRPGPAASRSTACLSARFRASVLANSVAYVDQDVFLFQGSVRQNVTLWDGSVDDVPLSSALKDAAVVRRDRRAARPPGCRGRQKAASTSAAASASGLEIARALSGDPAVLILDEATARPRSRGGEGDRREHPSARLHLHHHRASPEHDPRLPTRSWCCGKAMWSAAARTATLIESCDEYRRLIHAE